MRNSLFPASFENDKVLEHNVDAASPHLSGSCSEGEVLEPGTNSQVAARRVFYEGVSLYCRAEYEAALEKFRAAALMDDNIPHYHFCLGQTLARIPHRWREAELHYQRAILGAPTHPEYHFQLGQLYKKAGLHQLARISFAKALELDPGNQLAAAEI